MRTLITILAMLSAVATAAQQAPSTVTVERHPPIKLFKQTSDGNWVTTVKRDGKDVEYIYVPGTTLTPRVRTTLNVIDSAAARIEYRYRLINDAMSVQQLAQAQINTLPPITVRRAPAGWNVSDGGYLLLFGPFEGTSDVPSGIPPGSEDVVEFESAGFLPGVVRVSIMGNVRTELSDTNLLSDQQQDELLAISSHPTVDVRAIGPMISGGKAEPELTLQIMASRVAGHYNAELAVARHPYASEFAAAFEETLDGQRLAGALTKIRAITKRPVNDDWHRELSSAIGVCVDSLLAGHVPIR
jgi:hypothetical protein